MLSPSPKPRALTDFLGGINRLKRVIQHILRHARSRVTDRNLDIFARDHIRSGGGVVVIHIDVFRRNGPSTNCLSFWL